MCSIHANSAREAITKLCTLPLLAGVICTSRQAARPAADARRGQAGDADQQRPDRRACRPGRSMSRWRHSCISGTRSPLSRPDVVVGPDDARYAQGVKQGDYE
jgi:hypothetical protein